MPPSRGRARQPCPRAPQWRVSPGRHSNTMPTLMRRLAADRRTPITVRAAAVTVVRSTVTNLVSASATTSTTARSQPHANRLTRFHVIRADPTGLRHVYLLMDVDAAFIPNNGSDKSSDFAPSSAVAEADMASSTALPAQSTAADRHAVCGDLTAGLAKPVDRDDHHERATGRHRVPTCERLLPHGRASGRRCHRRAPAPGEPIQATGAGLPPLCTLSLHMAVAHRVPERGDAAQHSDHGGRTVTARHRIVDSAAAGHPQAAPSRRS